MGRKKTPLNIERQPGVGMSFVVKRQSDDALVRIATLCTRDIKKNPELGVIRKFSGAEPFFKARITRLDGGARLTDPINLTFDCRASTPVCIAKADGEVYEWLDLDHKVAVEDELTIVNDTPPKNAKDEIVLEETEEAKPAVEETEFVDVTAFEVNDAIMKELNVPDLELTKESVSPTEAEPV